VLRELDMEGFDLVVLDVSPDLSPLTTAALFACDDVFVVVVPTAGGVQDAYRSTEALRRLGLRHQLRYIVNRSRPGTDLTEPMADLGGQLIGDIPEDDSVVSAENAHRLVGLDESGPAAIALRRLARRFGSELRASWPA
jgi:MinD-like ATPase involved in chromosome partitioning or flagellar assembly